MSVLVRLEGGPFDGYKGVTFDQLADRIWVRAVDDEEVEMFRECRAGCEPYVFAESGPVSVRYVHEDLNCEPWTEGAREPVVSGQVSAWKPGLFPVVARNLGAKRPRSVNGAERPTERRVR